MRNFKTFWIILFSSLLTVAIYQIDSKAAPGNKTYFATQQEFRVYTSEDRLPVKDFRNYTTAINNRFANLTGSGITQSVADARYSAKAKTAGYYDLKADFGAVGDGVADDTDAISDAVTAAVANNVPLHVPPGTYNTNGGYVINDSIKIVGAGSKNTTFVLTANSTLFDISANYTELTGFDIKVPDANTASVIKYTTSATRLQGRGWGPTRKFIYSNSRLFSAGAEDWDQGTGYATIGDWTAIEFVGDTTGGTAGIDYAKLSDLYIEFPDTGIKFTKIGTGSTWFNANLITNIVMSGFKTAITTNGMSASGNTFSDIFLAHIRGEAAHGIVLDASSTSNTISGLSAWNDSGWVTTRSAFTPYEINGFGNKITGYAEYSSDAPPTIAAGNTANITNWVSRTASDWVSDDYYTFTGTQQVTDEAYDATSWNGNPTVPTKNAIRDKIETLSSGAGITGTTDGLVPYYDATDSRYEQASGLFYDDTNNNLGVKTSTPHFAIDLYGTTGAAARFGSRTETTSSSAGGSFALMHNNAKVGSDFVSPAAGDRLGVLFFGSLGTTETTPNSLFTTGIASYTESAWLHNYYCRSSGVPYGCCTGQGTGTCTASHTFSSDLRIETTETNARIERFRITSTGNVGVGNFTSSGANRTPTAALEIYSGGLQVNRADAAKPTCDATTLNTYWPDSSGTDTILYICAKASGVAGWRKITHAP